MAETVKKAKAPAAARKTPAKKTAAEPKLISHEQIRELAHHYWAERGQPHGQPEIDWFRAEQELRGKAS